MSRVILVRHAQSEANRDSVSLGREDSPLTDLGRRQAAAVGEALRGEPVAHVVSSPLARAYDTAAAIAGHHGLEPQADDRLLEMDVGELDGIPFEEARAKHADFFREWIETEADALPMPGGESVLDVATRAWPALAELLDPGSGAEPDGTTVLVSHNFVIKGLLCQAIDLELRFWRRFEVDLSSRSTLARRRGQVALYSLNDTAHLSPELRP
jgi:broad specificity phosphatase PhoE